MRSNGVAAILLAAACAAAGCHKRTPAASLPPAPPPPTAPRALPAPPMSPRLEPLPSIASPPPSIPLEHADFAFIAGSYDEAAREYESYLRDNPSGGYRDEALFRLGLTYALRAAPAGDWKRAMAIFKQLIAEFPHSPLTASANLILTLRADLEQVASDSRQRDQRIKQLTTELDRLKKIDAERRRRP